GPLGQVTVNDLYLQHLPGGVQRLWAATAGLGGLRVADPDADRVTWRTAPLEVVRALPTDFVRDVTGDALGRIFAATPRGIVQLRSVTPDSVVLETIYGVDEGLPSEDVYKIELTPDGELIVGTAEGVGRIRPESVALADNTALYLVARHVAGGDSVLTSGVRLPHDAAAVRFDMALLNYHREEQTRYRTELVGGAGGVSDWDAQPRTAFGALAPGSYRFRVWARDYRGQVHGPREFAFSVAPAPWASPAAYLAYVVFGTLGLALLIRWRTQAARRRAEELLVRERLALQNERKFRALFDRAFDAHLLVEQGTITTANPAGAALLAGGEAERLVGEPLARFLPDVEELPLGAPREGVTTRLDGSSVPTEVLLAEISTDEESARRLLHVTLRDLTVVREAAASRARLEERVRESQKLEALGTLAGGIAHDFNNLLTVIRGNAELARQATTPDPAHLEQILDVTGRARDLVRQILTFSRRSPAVMEPLDLAQVVGGLETLLRSSLPSSIELAITVPSEPVVVIGDATQLQQMVLNLTTNAEYAMRARGGTLALTVERIAVSTDGRTGHAALAPGRYARLEVRDTGLGMNAETLARVFEPFFTTKPVGEGTGLGLAVLHGIVASHRGSVSVESEPGWGTAFEILMPLAPVAPAREAPIPAAVADSVAPRVLLLDDDADVLAVTGRLLTRLGHRVESFGDPVSAVRWFREHAREVDVIVSDQTMPLLSGDRVIEAMRAIRPDVPAIIVTGFSHFLTPERVAALGQLEVLDKPVDARDLAAAIRAAHRRATEGASA
ncbi:MAG TPA: ATP-binding protein, partial [Gemmatimonadales bacterium]|nr:ATP-binding protein [Gemmatimonadales bacterium]